ncbi:MAG: hypothetical protein JKY02_00965 [Flavobacteriaceae bacterium]|nr:hypothetical protein [Flavobacteriaceae bacterium]
MADYKTPGVYVEEKNSFGSSIVANATAIPVFIGFTEQALQPNGQELNYIKDSDNVREPVLVSSVLEYEQTFGGPDETGVMNLISSYDSSANKTNYLSRNMKGTTGDFSDYTPGFMFPSISNFFANGGGSCYIVSLGNYDQFSSSNDSPVNMDFIIDAIEQAETATLIVPTDLVRYGEDKYYNWGTIFVDYCGVEKTYFCVLDVIQSNPKDKVYNSEDIVTYRTGVVPDATSYVAAYFPYLESLTSYAYNDNMSGIILDGWNIGDEDMQLNLYSGTGLDDEDSEIFTFTYSANVGGAGPKVTVELDDDNGNNYSLNVDGNEMTITYKTDATASDLNNIWSAVQGTFPDWDINFLMAPETATTTDYVQNGDWNTDETSDAIPFSISFNKLLVEESLASPESTVSISVEIQSDPEVTVTEITYSAADGMVITALENQTADEIVGTYPANSTDGFTIVATDPESETEIEAIAATDIDINYEVPNNAAEEDAKSFLSINYINMPPSPFMVGIYSRLDNASGVWTPPANKSPTGVVGPVVPITNKQQENLNVDATSGKSVNAIRSFTGKGTLVWGARTNDGNSLDWRYINVRRLFISMETDISKALEAYVFKPNVHNTWVEVKTMIESYLLGLYNDGAFAGTTPATSYSVLIGLGVTMTDEDILNGYMRVSIQVAPVRPAEFIVLTFSQMVGQ